MTYYWKRTKRNGSIAEGGYTWPRRLFGVIFLGEKYERLYSR